MNRMSPGSVLVAAAAALLVAAAWPLGCSSSPGFGPGGTGAGGGAGPSGTGAGGGQPAGSTTLASEQDHLTSIAVDATSVYWTTADGTVRKVPVGGGPVTVLASVPDAGDGNNIAVDATQVYWTVGSFGRGALEKVALDGGPVVTLAAGISPIDWFAAAGLVVDDTSVYWLESTSGWDPEIDAGQETNPPPIVKKVALGGGPVTVLASEAGAATGGIAVDATSVYWLEGDQLYARLMRAPKGGGAPTTLFAQPMMYGPLQSSLVLDAADVYWTSPVDDILRSMPKDGGPVTVLAGRETSCRLYSAVYGAGVAVDATGVTWISCFDGLQGGIDRVGLLGGPVSNLIAGYVAGIAVDATSVYWLDSNKGAVMKVAKGSGVPFDAGALASPGGVDAGDGLGCALPARFTMIDPGDLAGSDLGLVLDGTTGLVWMRYAGGYGEDSCGSRIGATKAEAEVFCEGLGMRLPTEAEALGVAATADTCTWPLPWVTWTSTPAGAGQAWTVSPNGEAATVVDDTTINAASLCVWGTCTQPGLCVCAGTGAACTENGQCCSRTCQGGACVCAALGAACQSGAACCSAACDAASGTCGCSAPGGACTTTAGCCLGTCQSGACVCSPPGAVCSSGNLCCSGACSNGNCTCISAGAPCAAGSDCCSGACTGGACACIPTGMPSCAAGGDCCSGSCGSGQCQCAPAGTACASNTLCCSASCANGACQ